MRKNEMDKAIVVWADGTSDTARECYMCGSPTCSYPVHNEKYKILNVGAKPELTDEELAELESIGLASGDVGELDAYIAKEDKSEDEHETN